MNKLSYIPVSFLTLSIIIFACTQKKQMNEINKPKQEAISNAADIFDNSCYEDRKVVKTIDHEEVEIVLILDYYMFRTENKRWQPCAVPEAFQKEGMKVKVSGEVMEIFNHERRAGTPFKITALEKI